MLNGIQEKWLNKNGDMNIKIRKYPDASLADILDHIKPSFRKEPDQNLNHAGANDHNDLNNVKRIVKIVKEICKDNKLCFSSLTYRTELKMKGNKDKHTSGKLL